MKLTGKQLKQLHDALLDAFAHSDLQRMVRFELDENLGEIAGGGNLSESVFNLIQWSERRGRTQDLIQGAVNYNPNNLSLLAVQRELLGESPTAEQIPQPTWETELPMDNQPDNPYAFSYSAQQLGGLAVRASVRLNPVHTAILHLIRKEKRPLITVDLTNQTQDQLRLRVLVEVEGYGRNSTRMAPLAPGASTRLDFFPAFDPTLIATVDELTGAAVRVQVEDLRNNSRWLDETLPLQLLAINSAPLAAWDPATEQRLDQTPYFGAFVTPNDPELDAFLHEAAAFLPKGHTFNGYQVRDVTPQVQALYDALGERGTVYVDSTLDFNPASAIQITQRVRLPAQALSARTANCIDGTLLMASLLEHIGIEPAIIILPKHALLGWAPYAGSDDWIYLETTLIGRSSFEKACSTGERKVKPKKLRQEKTGDDGYYRCWPLRDLRARGITPVPKVIGDELGRITRALETMERREEASDEPSSEPSAKPPAGSIIIDTGGGAYVGGNVQVGGNFIGRDKIVGQHVHDANDPPPTGQKSPAGGSMNAVKREMLAQRLDLLVEQYKAAYQQFNLTLSTVNRVKLDQTIKQLEQEIAEVESALATLDDDSSS